MTCYYCGPHNDKDHHKTHHPSGQKMSTSSSNHLDHQYCQPNCPGYVTPVENKSLEERLREILSDAGIRKWKRPLLIANIMFAFECYRSDLTEGQQD